MRVTRAVEGHALVGAQPVGATIRAHDVSSEPDRTLNVQLLGRVRASWCGTELRFGSRNALGLLALVVLRRRPRPRDAIAADLWPDGTASSGAALRQALWLVRSGLSDAGVDPDALLEVDDVTIGLRASVLVDLDTVRFEALMQSRPSRSGEAVALYRGELAEGLEQECFCRERERLADLYEDALADAATVFLARDDLEAAHDAAVSLISLDPLREEAHAVLIEIYGRSGARSQVIRQYRRLRSLLQVELGVEPLPETQAIFGAALQRTWLRSARRQAITALIPGASREDVPTRCVDDLMAVGQ
jgi:DNA-binding SARP family transcriptional activator